MFDKLKKAFSRAAKGIGEKELTEKVLDDALLDLQLSLLESDVAQEVVDDLSAKLKKEMLGRKLEEEQQQQDATHIVQAKLQTAVAEIFARAGRFDLIEKIKVKKQAKAGPFVIVFLGINGTGKTTTVAKIANLLRKAGFSVVVAAGDTHRAGAIEQLEQHTNRLSLKIVKQRYGADPSSVGRDAYEHAKKNYIDVVLMDTAGRMQTSKNLMDEMSKIVRVVKPDVKLFIGDALAGNDTINQAREFFQYTKFDGAILTKIDADAKGGSAISIAHITSKPVVYIGVGQGYDDIIPFDPDKFIGSLFGSVGEVSVENLISIPKASELVIEKAKSEETQEAKEEKKEEEEELLVLPKRPVQPSSRSVSIFAPKEEQNTEAHVPKPIAHQPEPSKVEEQPKEKKGRFGFFGKKRTDEDHRSKTEERLTKDEEKPKEESKREEDKDSKEQQEEQKDKVIYLTDEDIEDLLK
ncbi:MAG TPA: signal recognition particle-docking protein FtsY [Nitrososphaera sp.]|nr:signal recognition particle-docking protein FtsY [Nitrososphaera sp.]